MLLAMSQTWHGAINKLHSDASSTTCLVEDPLTHLVEEEMYFLRNADTDSKLRAAHGQGSGCHMWLVSQLLRDVEYCLALLLVDPGTSMERTIDRSDRNVSDPRNFMEPDPFHGFPWTETFLLDRSCISQQIGMLRVKSA